MRGGGAERLGLYVHVPFCEAKCTYCHFAIDPRRPDEGRQERYVRAVLAEMAALGEVPLASPADTLYFGGGTPSLLSPARLARLVEACRHGFDLPPGAEVTVEANPRDLDLPGYRDLRGLGANRLSLGVQSADEDVLRDMGRLHSARDAREAMAAARAAGFDNVSIDLILGWPGEDRGRWRRTLDLACGLGPEHLSLYVLEVEGKTLLQHRARRGELALPDDDLVAELYEETVDMLGGLGIERYEISNFARAGYESRHNRKYWDDAPFLGFGMSAHSYRAGRRSWNLATYGGYCGAVERGGGGAACAGERLLPPRERAAEALFTGLRRREGVDLAAFRDGHGVDALATWGDALRDPFSAGLLEVHEGCLRLTGRGMLLSNEVFRTLV